MTTLSILSGDFEILFDDETVGANAVAGMRMVRRASGASATIYTTNALYSAVAENADFFQAMSFTNPMLPVTPNAYTMENNYFIPRSSTEWLKEGAVDADWTVTSGDGVYRKVYTTVTAAPVSGDIGRQVTEATSGDTGTLLDFEVEPDGTTVLWIRPDTSGDTFALSTALTCTGDTGTCNVLGSGAAISGRSLWPSIQVIGSVYQGTDVYLYQNRFKMTDWEGGFQWWVTDDTVSLGIVDVLVRVINAGVTIADGDVEVFARQYTTAFDNFRLNIVGGGRSALPLASAPDINNTTGYRRTALTGGGGTWTAGAGIYQGATWAAATARGVLTVGGTGTTPTLEYYLTGDLTDLSGATAVKEYVFTTQIDGDGTGTAGAPAANLLGPTDTASGEGGTVTIVLGTTTRDHDGDGTAEPYSVTVDALTNVSIGKVYERMKYVCRRGATTADLFGAGTNVPGESYRGMEALFEYDANTSTMTQGEDIDTVTGGSTWTARLMAQNTTWTPTYITVTDQQTSIDAVVDNDVVSDEGGAGVTDVTVHSGGTLGIVSVASVKAAPFGTYTGTQIFGARGINYTNPASTDTQAYILTDDTGVLRNPPNTVAIAFGNTASGDRVFAARDNGTPGVIDKDQFSGLATAGATWNGTGDLQLRVAGTIDSEVATAGWVRAVATTTQEEHRYKYSDWTSPNFNLVDVNEGTGATTTSATNLIDTSATFLTAPVVEVGMLIRNLEVGQTDEVWEVTAVNSTINLSVKALYGSPTTWTATDTYEINHLIGRDHAATPADYTTADDVFDTTVDLEVTGTSYNNTLVKTLAANYGLVANVRQGKSILPFTQNVTVGDSGASITVVRTPDTIAV